MARAVEHVGAEVAHTVYRNPYRVDYFKHFPPGTIPTCSTARSITATTACRSAASRWCSTASPISSAVASITGRIFTGDKPFTWWYRRPFDRTAWQPYLSSPHDLQEPRVGIVPGGRVPRFEFLNVETASHDLAGLGDRADRPVGQACIMILPMAVASTGPATTRRPEASAAAWQSKRFWVPPPTIWIVSIRPPANSSHMPST